MIRRFYPSALAVLFYMSIEWSFFRDGWMSWIGPLIFGGVVGLLAYRQARP
jgi:hypothetical protein